MLRSRIQAIAFLVVLAGLVRAVEPPRSPSAAEFPPFIAALREWNALKERFEDQRRPWRAPHAQKPLDLQDLLSAGDQVLVEWNKLSEDERRHRFVDTIDSVRLVQARALADQGHYREALDKLNAEVAYQYTRESKAYLGWRGPHEFQALVCLEADILGHLGRTAHLENPDHFIAPVHVAGDDLDEFVAMEQSTADEVKSITIPPLPQGEEREIVYLLQAGGDGRYHVATNLQFIGRNGGRGKIEARDSDGSAAVILHRVTHEVEVYHDIPVHDVPARYVPLTNDTVTLNVSREGLTKIETSQTRAVPKAGTR